MTLNWGVIFTALMAFFNGVSVAILSFNPHSSLALALLLVCSGMLLRMLYCTGQALQQTKLENISPKRIARHKWWEHITSLVAGSFGAGLLLSLSLSLDHLVLAGVFAGLAGGCLCYANKLRRDWLHLYQWG